MPKPFTISIDVEEAYLGHVMRRLNSLEGVIAIDFDFDQPSVPAKKNGHLAGSSRGGSNSRRFQQRGEGTGHDLAMRLLTEKPMTAREISAKFAEAGRSPNSINSVLHDALSSKRATRNAKGEYVITSKGRDHARKAAATLATKQQEMQEV